MFQTFIVRQLPRMKLPMLPPPINSGPYPGMGSGVGALSRGEPGVSAERKLLRDVIW